jgi:hypothetical protein
MSRPTQDLTGSQLSFSTLPSLPNEITDRILWYWIALQEVDLTDTATDGELLLTYASPTDALAESLPPSIRKEYWRIHHLCWLVDSKYFTSPYDLYMSHHILGQNPLSTYPPLSVPAPQNLAGRVDALIAQPHPLIQAHGLEKIILDFDATQYFALFTVHIPPFDIPNLYDPILQGAASVLQHCQELVLIFGDAYRYTHPWYDIKHPIWEEARYRPHICEMGKVLDWILDAAWQGGYVQHIRSITLEADVQERVREKWARVFQDGVYEPEKVVEHERPWEVYPPMCECTVGCWELGMKNSW